MKLHLAKRLSDEFQSRVVEILDPVPLSFRTLCEKAMAKTVALSDENESIQDSIVPASDFYWEVVCMDAVANTEDLISGKLGENEAFKMTSGPYKYLEEVLGDEVMENMTALAVLRLQDRSPWAREDHAAVRIILKTDLGFVH